MKRFLAALLAVVVLFTIAIPKQSASADVGLTLSMVSSGIAAIASASGLDFGFTGFTGASAKDWFENRVNSFLAGRSLSEVFGDEVFRIVSGKLIIPAAAVTGITSFLSDMISRAGLTENSGTSTKLSVGMFNGQIVYPYYSVNSQTLSKQPLSSFGDGGMPSYSAPVITTNSSGYKTYTVTPISPTGEAGSSVSWTDTFSRTVVPRGYFLMKGQGVISLYVYAVYEEIRDGVSSYASSVSSYKNLDLSQSGTNVTGQIPGAYSPPESLNDLQSWEGTVSNAPDTNLDQLMEDIFDQSAAGTLDVTGEVVDTPAEPQVSPVPTAAPGDVIGLDTISGQLESIDNTMTSVQEGVGEAVGQLEGINEGIGSISEALEVPTVSEAPAFKFDLTTLFPFCIPFDIYRFVTMFSASPVAPHVQIPFNIPAVGLQYTFDLDFSSFDSVASVLRSVELIAFCVGLAILTSKVIRW